MHIQVVCVAHQARSRRVVTVCFRRRANARALIVLKKRFFEAIDDELQPGKKRVSRRLSGMRIYALERRYADQVPAGREKTMRILDLYPGKR